MSWCARLPLAPPIPIAAVLSTLDTRSAHDAGPAQHTREQAGKTPDANCDESCERSTVSAARACSRPPPVAWRSRASSH